MERNSKHGPRVDDAIAANAVGSPAEGLRKKEPFGTGLGDDIDLRSELTKQLRTSAFPADRQTLEQVALEDKAPAHILDLIGSLPEDTTFENTEDVWRAAYPVT